MLSRTFLFKYLKENYSINDFSFSYTDIQRPKLKDINIDFNISYAKDLVAIAISTKDRIGIDIEYINHSFDIENTANYFMNEEESNRFNSLKDKERFDYYYKLWTFKEALLKLTGKGLHDDLKEITNFETNGLKISRYQPFISKDYHLCITKYK